MSVSSAGLEGFALSLGLILALGPQNVFVLRQGLLRSHVFAVCLVCSLADASLIAAGVLGMGSILSGIEGAEFVIAIAAGAFLTGYGLLRIKSANLMPTLSVRSRYVGPMPRPVVPTTRSAPSYSLWNGRIIEARSLMNSRFPSGLSPVRACHLSSSSSSTQGSITIPSPSTRLQ